MIELEARSAARPHFPISDSPLECVLVIGRDVIEVRDFMAALRSTGCCVLVAGSIAQSLHHLALVSPDLIVVSSALIEDFPYCPWSRALRQAIPLMVIESRMARAGGRAASAPPRPVRLRSRAVAGLGR